MRGCLTAAQAALKSPHSVFVLPPIWSIFPRNLIIPLRNPAWPWKLPPPTHVDLRPRSSTRREHECSASCVRMCTGVRPAPSPLGRVQTPEFQPYPHARMPTRRCRAGRDDPLLPKCAAAAVWRGGKSADVRGGWTGGGWRQLSTGVSPVVRNTARNRWRLSDSGTETWWGGCGP